MTDRKGAKSGTGFLLLLLLSAMALSGSPSQATAQQIGDAMVGRQLAERWCSSCHVVGSEGVSGTSNGAPTFAAIAGMKSTTPLSLRAFFQTPHARMPDLHLSRDETDDLGAYILSLQHE